MIRYWRKCASYNLPHSKESCEQRRIDEITYLLEGLLFSILVCLDGGSHLPGFAVIPAPHESDKDFLQSEGENWFPPWSKADPLSNDIAGGLHEHMHQAIADHDPLVKAQLEICRLRGVVESLVCRLKEETHGRSKV
jgi:hypothetical protein